MNLNLLTRRFHRWGAIATAIPLFLVIATGLILQVKKEAPWVQPPTSRGMEYNVTPSVDWDTILSTVQAVPEAEVNSWEDVDRLDVRLNKGVVKVRCRNMWEVQLDLQTSEVLSSTLRRSDWIESLHDGSFFSDGAKLWVFLPNGIVLLILWGTGLWLWYLPFNRKSKRRRKSAATAAADPPDKPV